MGGWRRCYSQSQVCGGGHVTVAYTCCLSGSPSDPAPSPPPSSPPGHPGNAPHQPDPYQTSEYRPPRHCGPADKERSRRRPAKAQASLRTFFSSCDSSKDLFNQHSGYLPSQHHILLQHNQSLFPSWHPGHPGR